MTLHPTRQDRTTRSRAVPSPMQRQGNEFRLLSRNNPRIQSVACQPTKHSLQCSIEPLQPRPKTASRTSTRGSLRQGDSRFSRGQLHAPNSSQDRRYCGPTPKTLQTLVRAYDDSKSILPAMPNAPTASSKRAVPRRATERTGLG